ncbi:MAG: DUF1127 domain-containing protein [Deltaproteobacteria bacterium]|nr:DUF1127 domain-containing protein [Deltaproteobacteria bacterium]
MSSPIAGSEPLERAHLIRSTLPVLATEELLEVTLTAAWLLLCRIPVTLKKWRERSSQRADLHRLDRHLLRDIGLTPGQARMESAKWFWQR